MTTDMRTHVVDTFSAEFKCTVRDCLGCGALVAGGPSRCSRCANDPALAPTPPAAVPVGEVGEVVPVCDVCEWHECDAAATTTRTDIGGSTFGLCAQHDADGEVKRYWRPRADSPSPRQVAQLLAPAQAAGVRGEGAMLPIAPDVLAAVFPAVGDMCHCVDSKYPHRHDATGAHSDVLLAPAPTPREGGEGRSWFVVEVDGRPYADAYRDSGDANDCATEYGQQADRRVVEYVPRSALDAARAEVAEANARALRLLTDRDVAVRQREDMAERYERQRATITDATEACGSCDDDEWTSLPDAVGRLRVTRATLRAQLAEAERERDEAKAKIAESVVNCPGCGRHDFALWAGPIARMLVAETALASALERVGRVEGERDALQNRLTALEKTS